MVTGPKTWAGAIMLAAGGMCDPACADGLNGCTWNGIELHGDVEVVDSFPDIKVQVVNSFPDLKVQWVDSFPDSCGQWHRVESFGDFKIQYVDSFPDVTIEPVDSFPGVP